MSRIEEIAKLLANDRERWALLGAVMIALDHEAEFRKRFGGFGWDALKELCPLTD